MELSGLVALVTGATGGIGSAIASQLASLGATVAAHGSKAFDLRAYDFGNDAFAVSGDVVRDADAIVGSCLSQTGRLDILVNNAGIWPVGELTELTDDDVAETIRVNLLGVAAMTRASALAMTNGGAVCNIASIEAFGAPSMHSHYVASKAGVLGHTKAAAVELGTRGIRVNAVAPGLIERPNIAREWPEGVGRWTRACPLGRLGTGFDVAKAVAFLVGPSSAWITGTCLVVDGGMTARSPW